MTKSLHILFRVIKKAQREGATFDAQTMERSLNQHAQQAASCFMQELYQKANVVDNRYLFF